MSILKNIKSNKIAEMKEAKLKLVSGLKGSKAELNSELKLLENEYNHANNLLNDKNSESRGFSFDLLWNAISFFIGLMLWKFGTSERVSMKEHFFLSFIQAFGPLIGTFLIIGCGIGGVKALIKYSNSSSESSTLSDNVRKSYSKKEDVKIKIKNIENKINEAIKIHDIKINEAENS